MPHDNPTKKAPKLKLKSRPRRLRRTPAIRAMIQENNLSVANLIWPLFLQEGNNTREPVASMPGVVRLSLDLAVEAAQKAADLGIPALCLFPYTDPALKTQTCEEAWNPNNLINRAIRKIKAAVPDIAIMTDVALDPYNINGHDGLVENGVVLNDETVAALVRMALVQAECGADIIGPSDMMDGRVGAIRTALETAEHQDVIIMSYAAKYASAFYGPFRDAVGASSALKGNKKSYQIAPANGEEALRMIARDIEEGADMIMVKPGIAYLDVCKQAKSHFNIPLFAYQVSGEYAMIAAAEAKGWVDGDAAIMESMMAFRRAGCDGVLTYFAPRIARLLRGGWQS